MPPGSLPRFRRIAAVLIWLLRRAAAQSSPSADAHSSPAATIVIILIAVLFIVTGFLSVFLRHLVVGCLGHDDSPLGLGTYGPRPARGLDPDIVKTFPTFLYSDVKMHRQSKTALECAVCLSEFENDDLLRLLPGCSHVFHTHCIDPWLASRVTCPICRADLEPTGPAQAQAQRPSPQPDPARNINDEDRDLILNIRKSPELRDRTGLVKFTRSHSTGHSLVRPGEDLERFTLRLPDPVRSGLVSLNLPGLVSPRWVFDGARSSEGLAGDKPGSNREGSRWGWFSMTPSFINGRSSPAAAEEGTPPRSLMSLVKSPLNRPAAEDAGERSSDRLWAGRAV